MSNEASASDRAVPSRLSRRELIAAGAAGALALGGGWSSALAAGRRGLADAAAAKPVRGGTMTVGMITGGTAETVNPGIAIAAVDTLRCHQLYDTLFDPGPDIKTLVPRLAVVGGAEQGRDGVDVPAARRRRVARRQAVHRR